MLSSNLDSKSMKGEKCIMAYGGKTDDYLRANDAQIKGKDVVDSKGNKIGYVTGDGCIRDNKTGNYYEPRK